MIKLFEMTAFLLLIACGNQLSDSNSECQVYDELYSHTVLFCNGYDTDDVEDVFRACNYRLPFEERDPDCVSCDVMDFQEGCQLQHVCFVEKAYWEVENED